jgi:hypothetical protein
LGNRHDRQKIVLVQSRPGSAHVNERGDRSVGQI